jgi:hypothetical protein
VAQVQKSGGAGGEAGDEHAGREGKEGRLFVNKKKQKKFLLLVPLTRLVPQPAGAKVFWFFFSKKNRLLPYDKPLTSAPPPCGAAPILS